MRKRAYQALSKAMGKDAAHISWMDAEDCLTVVSLVKAGRIQTGNGT